MEARILTLPEMIDRAAERYPEREAIVFRDEKITYKEVWDRSNKLAKGLLKLGVQKGDKVGILITNRPEYAYSEWAIAKCGAIMVPIFSRFQTHDIEYILKTSDASTIIMMDRFAKLNYVEMLTEICPELPESNPGSLKTKLLPLLKNVICFSEDKKKHPGTFDFDEVMELGSDYAQDDQLQTRQSTVKLDDIINIPYTAGTTGFPKGVMTNHEQYYREVVYLNEVWGINEKDSLLSCNPFVFNMGNMSVVVGATLVGARGVYIESWDPAEALRLIDKEKVTCLYGFAAIYTSLLDHPDLAKYKFDSLKFALISLPGVSNREKLVERVKNELGVKNLAQAYGMTENSGGTTSTMLGDPLEVVANSVGKPFPDVELKIVDEETGKEMPPGEEGELLTRGYIVMKGYYGKPEEAAKVIDKDGWFHTGDKAYFRPDGNLVIKGRIRDVVKTGGGLLISSAEIESIVAQNPKVKDVQVTGVPDPKRLEVPMAFVILNEGQTATEEEIINFCKEQKVSSHKIPQHVMFVNSYPLSGIGKIQKFKLKDMAIEKLGLVKGA